jgi:signal transduction histidine kinase
LKYRTTVNLALPKDELNLDRKKTTAIFRIFQEALTNIARHSEAQKVLVSLYNHQRNIYLEIQDNGKGITHEQIKDFKSLGIHGMKERAMVFGGEVYIEGIPGKGTIVKVEIPYH